MAVIFQKAPYALSPLTDFQWVIGGAMTEPPAALPLPGEPAQHLVSRP
jgi:hypothetical protein